MSDRMIVLVQGAGDIGDEKRRELEAAFDVEMVFAEPGDELGFLDQRQVIVAAAEPAKLVIMEPRAIDDVRLPDERRSRKDQYRAWRNEGMRRR